MAEKIITGRAALRAGTVESNVVVRRQKALALRRGGASYRRIASELRVSRETARKDVRAVLEELAEDTKAEASEYVTMELARLDQYLSCLQEKIEAGVLQAIDRAIRVSESRRKLIGLDSPAKQDVDLNAKIPWQLIDEITREMDAAGD